MKEVAKNLTKIYQNGLKDKYLITLYKFFVSFVLFYICTNLKIINSFKTLVYRKPTYTNRNLNFFARYANEEKFTQF